jgi:pyroglutamyl-peptidase
MVKMMAKAKRKAARRPSGRILVTGFEPFGKFAANPSWESARRLDGWIVAGRAVTAVRLPVSWGRSGPALEKALREVDPDAAILAGLQGAPFVSLERYAHNLDDCPDPDNDGEFRAGVPIRDKGPAAHESTLPLKDIERRLREAGIASALSGSAGFFLCNHVFYLLMEAFANRAGRVGGFLHVPPTSDLDPAKGWPPDRVEQALRIAVQAAAEALPGPGAATDGRRS